jgi:hypothetical protein
MLFFLFILLAIAIGVSFVNNRNKPLAVITRPLQKNQFKEEFAMEKETKVIKESVKSTENDKIEKIAAAKVEAEIGEELTPLKSQLDTIQHALNQVSTGGQQSSMSYSGQNQQQSNQQQSNQLLGQLQQFSSQAQQQQQKTFQQLQQSIHQATQMLSNVEQSLQSVNLLNQISQQINQSQQQLQQQYQQQNQGQMGMSSGMNSNQSYQQ